MYVWWSDVAPDDSLRLLCGEAVRPSKPRKGFSASGCPSRGRSGGTATVGPAGRVASGAEAEFAAQCVDEEALFLASDFPIKPEDLVARAKEVLTLGIGTKDEGACLAEGFEFCAPVVGPLPKEEYLKALAGFKLE